jgi:hypothetical protein
MLWVSSTVLCSNSLENGQRAGRKKIKTSYPVPNDAVSIRIFFDVFDENEAADQSVIKVSRASSTASWQGTRPASLQLRADKVEVNVHILGVIDGMVTPMRGGILG